jgi:hypothetical protein
MKWIQKKEQGKRKRELDPLHNSGFFWNIMKSLLERLKERKKTRSYEPGGARRRDLEIFYAWFLTVISSSPFSFLIFHGFYCSRG